MGKPCYEPAVSTMSQVTKSQHGIVTKVIEEGNSKSKLRNRFTIAWLNTLLSSTPIVIDDAGTTRRSPWSLSTSVSFFPLATWSLLVIWHSPSRIRLSAAKSTQQNGTRLRRCRCGVVLYCDFIIHTHDALFSVGTLRPLIRSTKWRKIQILDSILQSWKNLKSFKT